MTVLQMQRRGEEREMPDQDGSMSLLIFSLNGRRFGLDTAQIAEIIDLRDVERMGEISSGSYRIPYRGEEVAVVALAERIGLEGRLTYTTPKVVLPRAGGVRVGFLIGDLEEVVSVPVDDIELLPELVERIGAGAGVWGIAKREEHLIILIDLMEAGDADGTTA